MTKYQNRAEFFPAELPQHEEWTPPVAKRDTFVPAVRESQPEMSSMPAAANLATLTQSPGVHVVELNASYDDRASGFVRSTMPLWWAASGAAATLVLVVWIIGPLSGRWAFAVGWWAMSELGAIALTSIAVWALMWWKWHYDGPDAIASRSADARLRMAEKWFDEELRRVYGQKR